MSPYVIVPLECGKRESDIFKANYEILLIQIKFENFH